MHLACLDGAHWFLIEAADEPMVVRMKLKLESSAVGLGRWRRRRCVGELEMKRMKRGWKSA